MGGGVFAFNGQNVILDMINISISDSYSVTQGGAFSIISLNDIHINMTDCFIMNVYSNQSAGILYSSFKGLLDVSI